MLKQSSRFRTGILARDSMLALLTVSILGGEAVDVAWEECCLLDVVQAQKLLG